MNIEQGEVFKNYKELCERLGEPVKSGDSKKAQLKEWERRFSYQKQGHKIIITEVFNTLKKKKTKYKGSNNQVYSKDMDTIILSYLNGGEWLFNDIFVNIAPILSPTYNQMVRNGCKTFAKANNISEGLTTFYAQKLRKILENALKSSLNRLQKQEQLQWGLRYITNSGICLNDWQESLLKKAENKALEEMGIVGIQRFNSVINRQVKRKVCKNIDFNLEIKNYWKVYCIEREDIGDKDNEQALKSLTKTIILRLHEAVKKNKIYSGDKYVSQVLILDRLLFNYEMEDLSFMAKMMFINDEDIPF